MDPDTILENGLIILIYLVLALPTLLMAYYFDCKPSGIAKMDLKMSPKDLSPALSSRQWSRSVSKEKNENVQYRIRMQTYDSYEFINSK